MTVFSHLDIPSAIKFKGQESGPMVSIFGSIHGNEPAGAYTISRLLFELVTHQIQLKKGSLTLAIGNERALDLDQRFIQSDLNRQFKDSQTSFLNSEMKRANQLKEILENSDLFLDIHSTQAKTEPFIICEEHLIEEALSFGFEYIVTGWEQFSSCSGDTETFVNRHGGKGFTAECGQNHEYKTFQQAYDLIYRFLYFCDLIDTPPEKEMKSKKVFHLIRHQLKTEDDFVFVKEFRNFDKLAINEVIGVSATAQYKAPSDSYIVMPSNPETTGMGKGLYFLAESRQ